jgi:hypothetical protein
MTGMPREIPQLRTAFAKSYDRPSTPLLHIPGPGRGTAVALEGTCFRDTPLVWCISFATMLSKSSRWLTVGAGLATGDRDSEVPSNIRMQRSALRAAADPDRSATWRLNG